MTTISMIFAAFIVSMTQKKGSEKKAVEEVEEEPATSKEGYEATVVETAPVAEEQSVVVEEQPAVIASESSPRSLDDSTGSISSQSIFFVNQVCRTSTHYSSTRAKEKYDTI
eukprot:TRINITY_DN6067_c0_g1_i2.p1 TRINITY_DN6067_c0_g1~~TRINITY_DN6067_c0_g1_i2.p1  ORF type:complete len:112 (-),score=27.01 TRINITY_DN6067_c0_g1_i2:83-418(-)